MKLQNSEKENLKKNRAFRGYIPYNNCNEAISNIMEVKMKKRMYALLCASMAIALGACSGQKQSTSVKEETTEWTREGYFLDDNENMLTVMWMEDTDEPGWYVSCMLGEDFMEDSWSGILPQEGNSLHGELPTYGSKDPITVTVSEEGEKGMMLVVEGGETYHFTEMEMEEATIFVSVNTEGWGNIEYAEGEEAPEIDPEYPYQSAQINIAEPATYTFTAWPEAGSVFVKWTKNGEEYSADPTITVLLDESADFIAVFEEDPDYVNPITDYVGNYQCDRANAKVETFGVSDTWITIEWGSSASETARWYIVGSFDPETKTINYTGASKANVTYDESGEITEEESVYDDGTGTVVFNDDGTFTWHEDQSESGEDMVFAWLSPLEEE